MRFKALRGRSSWCVTDARNYTLLDLDSGPYDIPVWYSADLYPTRYRWIEVHAHYESETLEGLIAAIRDEHVEFRNTLIRMFI